MIDIDGISSGVLKDEETLTEQNRRLSIPDVDIANDLILEDELGNHNVLREESSLFELKLEQDPTIDNIILDGTDALSANEGEFLLKENILDNELIQLEQSECPDTLPENENFTELEPTLPTQELEITKIRITNHIIDHTKLPVLSVHPLQEQLQQVMY